ncbi:MAG: DNA repair protein RadA [Deltaproteobacteria bacterium]|nr:DNA repair protein RadA [Deltaproteobacteria bacterium]MBI4796498.1 DNA repair protein RadA [Deltaproteobacteria bacterium]
MARGPKTVFICQSCGYQTGKWLGRCPECGAWNSLAEEVVAPAGPLADSQLPPRRGAPQPLVRLQAPPETRLASGLTEFDRTLGGSVVAGSVVLLGGDPGIGKSTLILQVLDRLSGPGRQSLYISGEESEAQLKLRADRLGLKSPDLLVATETCLENILKILAEHKPAFLALDSIQTMYTATLPAAPGSLTQVRETAFRLVQQVKLTGTAAFLIGHVTKEGALAGPMVLEHLVDTVLYLEGDRSHTFRLLRTVKNRFGPTQELGVFEMQEAGLLEVSNPSALFLAERSLEVPGAVVVPSLEGSRPILVEVQALVSPTSLAVPRRQSMGVDQGRVSLLVAVLEKRVGLALSGQDLFVNVAGGVRLTEPAVDLGVALALSSSLLDRAVPSDTLIFGEVGLTGEVRAVSQPELRLKEGHKLGFRRALLAQRQKDRLGDFPGLELLGVDTLAAAIRSILPR